MVGIKIFCPMATINNNWYPISEQQKKDLKIRIDNGEMETNGKVFRIKTVNKLSEETISQILSYVGKINSLVNPKWKGGIQTLWLQILNHKELSHLFFSKPQSKKCKEFEKNNVLRIVGILRENNVYQNHYNNTQIHRLIENTNKDSNLRVVIGNGLDRKFTNIILCIIRGCNR